MKLGILGAADIAFRRFLPALRKCPDITYAGVASRTPEKAARFLEAYGGRSYPSYDALLADESIDAVYVPLPPALHYGWGKKVLDAGKHLFLEKPFTVDAEQTGALIDAARKRGLMVYENYAFIHHAQLAKIREMAADGTLGGLRLLRASFGFPMRGGGDFRYRRDLGGGALLDCGGYPLRLALELLGGTARVVHSRLERPEGHEVDLYGSVVLSNDDGLCFQAAFGMDNAYQCRLEVWGSKMLLTAPRIFTAGADFCPSLILRSSVDERRVELEADDQFLHAIEFFASGVLDRGVREQTMRTIARQAELTSDVRRGCGAKGMVTR